MKVRTLTKVTPHVHIPDEVWDDMMHITQLVDKEVGWLSRVVREESLFTIGEVYLPKQQTSGATTEMEPEFLHTFAEDLMGTMPIEEFLELNESLKCWAHSHANMGVTPSGQDQTTIEKLLQSCDYFVALRVNKRGEVQADVALGEIGLICEDVAVSIGSIDTVRREYWEALVKERVLPMPSATKGKGTGTGTGFSWDDDYGRTWQDGATVYSSGLDKSAPVPLDEPVKAFKSAPYEVDRECRSMKSATRWVRSERVDAWYSACNRVWGLTTGAYEMALQAKDDSEAEKQLALLIAATYSALANGDKKLVDDIIRYSHYENFRHLLLAGWQASMPWFPIIRAYQDRRNEQDALEQRRMEVLTS